MALKSGVSLIDLLRFFGSVPTSLTISTTGEPYQLAGFSLHFLRTSDFYCPNAIESDDNQLAGLIGSYDCASSLAEMERIELEGCQFTEGSEMSTSAKLPTCLSIFREQLASSLRHSVGSSIEHPVGCLLVASATQSSKPDVTFKALLKSAYDIPEIADGTADPGFPRLYILLHDISEADATASVAQSALAEATQCFGVGSCHLVSINSRKSDTQPFQNICTTGRHVHARSDDENTIPETSLLASHDVDQLRDLVQGPVTKQARVWKGPSVLVHSADV